MAIMNVYQTHLEEEIFSMIELDLTSMGYEVVRIKLKGGAKHKTLQIMIEKPNAEQVSIDDCEKASRHISTLLDVKDPLESEYSLEVSSPGLNRPLTRLKDYAQSIGKRVKISTKLPINGQRNFQGILKQCKDSMIEIQQEYGENAVLFVIDADNIMEANLQFELNKQPKKRRR